GDKHIDESGRQCRHKERSQAQSQLRLPPHCLCFPYTCHLLGPHAYLQSQSSFGVQ
ncbi:unnamed protein product, partial [Musa acuminata subsp. burmannicoides]